MNRLQLKYQQLFTTLLLCAYLVGNLSIPFFEGVHLLLHLGDDSPLHSFQSHDPQHQHQVLNCLEELVSTSSSTDFPAENSYDKNLKKITQQVEIPTSLSLTYLSTNTTNYPIQFVAYQLPFLPLNSPPPEV